jgi:small subunit ribosomal protein S11
VAKKQIKKKGKKELSRKRKKRNVPVGLAHVLATFNNTIITLSDTEGATLIQGSPRTVGFAGSKRSTAFAATKAAADAAEKAMKKYGLKEVEVFIAGPGSGRNAAVKGLDSAGLKITKLVDRTPIPHNGCRARKRPRK